MRWVLFAIACVVSCAQSQADTLVVVTSRRCQPCESLKRDLKSRPDAYQPHDLVILEGREAAKAWGVTGVPTMIRVRDGQEVRRRVGYKRIGDVLELMKD